MNIKYLSVLFFLIGVMFFNILNGQEKESEHLKFSVFKNKDIYNINDTIKIAGIVKIKEKYHINSNNPSDPNYIKTEMTLVKVEGFRHIASFYPPDKIYQFKFSSDKLNVFEKEVIIGLFIIPNKDIKNGEYNLNIKLRYQACDDKACYPPLNIEIPLKIKIDNDAKNSEFINKDIFSQVDFSKPIQIVDETKVSEKQTNTKQEIKKPDEEVSDIMESKGLVIGLILIFLGGLALNLTPCVYPLIPITISYFGAQASGNKAQSIFMGVFYALGMSVTYSALGVFAALTGSMFGTALQNPIVIFVVAIIFIALALSMFGLYEIRIPQKLALAGNKNRKGFLGSFIMGLLVGFIAAPCIGPFVLSLLVYVGKVGATMSSPIFSGLFGLSLFFVLSMGLGLPYVILAAFSSSLNKLPRSGEWMIGVKVVFGFILIGMALNTISPVIPKGIYQIVFPIFLFIAGIYLIIFDTKGQNSKVWTKLKYFIAILAIAYGGWILKPEKSVYNVDWQMNTSYEQIQQTVKSKNMPVMIDFYADWCAQCKELDEYTYTNKEVAEYSKNFNTIKVDLTKENPTIEKTYEIKGLPVVLFMNSKGEEIKELRLTGFEKPEDFLKRLKKVQESDK